MAILKFGPSFYGIPYTSVHAIGEGRGYNLTYDLSTWKSLSWTFDGLVLVSLLLDSCMIIVIYLKLQVSEVLDPVEDA